MGCGASSLATGHRNVDERRKGENSSSASSRAISSMRSANPSAGGTLRVFQQEFKDIKEVYAIGKVIGKGQFGTCRVVTHKASGTRFACKSIAKRQLSSPDAVLDVRREVQIMHHLAGHPNIVNIEDVFEDAQYVHLVEELCTGGELFDSIIMRGHYSERDAAAAFRCIASVVAHCHTMGVLHRDIKPENFLLSSRSDTATIKGTDFGLSVFFTEGQQFKEVVGSAFYVAPEVLRKRYDKRADVWSLGVLLYIMLSGMPPFYADTEREVFRAILTGELSFAAEPWPSISDSAKAVIRRMLDRNPAARATAAEVLTHEWVREDGTAGAAPLHNEVLVRLQNFAALNKLQQEALKIIATNLPEPEVMGLRTLFSEIDTDGSGSITLDELKQALYRKGTRIGAEELQRIMAHADISGDGTLDYEEFLAATMHLTKLKRQENLHLAFRAFDADDSGYITREELTQVLNKTCSPEEIDELLAQADSSGDGRIDYTEFCELMRGGNPAMSRAVKALPPALAPALAPAPGPGPGPAPPAPVLGPPPRLHAPEDLTRLRVESISQLDALAVPHVQGGRGSQPGLDGAGQHAGQQQAGQQGEPGQPPPSRGGSDAGGLGAAVRPPSSCCVMATPTPRRLHPTTSMKQQQQQQQSMAIGFRGIGSETVLAQQEERRSKSMKQQQQQMGVRGSGSGVEVGVGLGGNGEESRGKSMAVAVAAMVGPPLPAPLPRMHPSQLQRPPMALPQPGSPLPMLLPLPPPVATSPINAIPFGGAAGS